MPIDRDAQCGTMHQQPDRNIPLRPLISTRKCSICGEVKPLTTEHFQAIPDFVDKFSFYCNACDAESKIKKTRPEGV